MTLSDLLDAVELQFRELASSLRPFTSDLLWLAVALIVFLLVIEPTLSAWLRVPSVRISYLRRLRRLDRPTSSAALKVYFSWHVDQVRQTSRGIAALGVALLLAYSGALIDAAKVQTETTGVPPEPKMTVVKTVDFTLPPFGWPTIAALWFTAVALGVRERAARDSFAAHVTLLK